MDEHSREIVFSSEHQDWTTPPGLFAQLDDEFRFNLDAAATELSAKCGVWYGPGSPDRVDALSPYSWGDREAVWLNPPYGRQVGQFVARAHQEAQEGATVVCLIFARTDTRWWHDHVMHADEVRFIRGRVKFHRPGNPESSNAAPAPSAVVIWRPFGHGPPRFTAMEQNTEG